MNIKDPVTSQDVEVGCWVYPVMEGQTRLAGDIRSPTSDQSGEHPMRENTDSTSVLQAANAAYYTHHYHHELPLSAAG